MDGRRFDDLLRSLTDSRRSLLGGSLAAFAGLLGVGSGDAKKKKKKNPCKKCKGGCCTKKFGKCIKPAQQTEDQCGTGGEICHPCEGGEPCGSGCDTCCANGECVDAGQMSNEQCGVGGEDVCEDGFCGRPEGASCVPGEVWCTPQSECNPSTLICGGVYPEGESLCGSVGCCPNGQCEPVGDVCCPAPQHPCFSLPGPPLHCCPPDNPLCCV